MSDYNWYVAQTKPRNEYRAERELSKQGYESFLPEIQVRRLIKGRERTVTEPLFPRYIFIRLSKMLSSWSPILSTRGVTRFIAFGGSEPLPVSDATLERVRADCRGLSLRPRLKPGDRVTIGTSRLTDVGQTEFVGRLASLDGKDRAVVLLSLLGRENTVRIPTHRLTLV